MWFLFGIITLVAAFITNLTQRTQANWKGKPAALDGVNYDAQYVFHSSRSSNKKTLSLVRVGLRGMPPGFNFALRAVTGMDRWANRIGILAEHPFHDPAFEDRYFLESDNATVIRTLGNDAKLRELLRRVFDTERARGVKIKRIICRGGRLWCEYYPGPGRHDPTLGDTMMMVPMLHALGDALRAYPPLLTDQRDPFALRAAIILALNSATLWLGIVSFYGIFLSPTIVDDWGLFRASAVPGLIAFVLFLLISMRLLGNTSRARLVLAELLLIGSVGFVLSAHALMRAADISFDSGSMQSYTISNIWLERRTGRRSTSYYFHSHDWPPQLARVGYIRVDYGTYTSLQHTKSAVVNVMPGAIGYAWVDSVVPASK